jgi:glutamate N-acetyltransferase / amino-acid N-acetyltransferase
LALACQDSFVTKLPRGFKAHVANIGIKDETDDFCLIVAEDTAATSGVFTQSRFVGPSVSHSRKAVADGASRAIAIISKNANVANGKAGTDDTDEIVKAVAAQIGCSSTDVILASTGVIGRRYPMDKIRGHLEAPLSFTVAEVEACAKAIMTTDTVMKVASASFGAATVVGFAKGVGMIEPNMATLIAVFLTDARLAPGELRPMFKSVMDQTFNCVSVDTDTSTSDTAVIMASGAAGYVDRADFTRALHDVALSLTKQVARDGEGATKLLEVTVDGARDDAQAKRVAKSIVNSPLVKTAVHGADPNWGRVAMAIGKCEADTDINQDRVVIRFGEQELYPTPVSEGDLGRLTDYLNGAEVTITVSLGIGNASSTVWGCDLSAGYVRINGEYTT